MQRGFISIPILIAIMISAVIFGGSGYFIATKIVQPVESISNNKTSASAPATNIYTVASTPVKTTIKKQTMDDFPIKIQEQKPVPTISQAPESQISTLVSTAISAPINPAAQCLPTKKDWDIFAVAINNLDTKIESLLKLYNELSFGTANRPIELVAKNSYDYVRMTIGKSRFLSQAEEIKKIIDVLPQIPADTNNDLQKIKDGYSKALLYYQNSYELDLQSSKVIADAKDNISIVELETSLSLLRDAANEYKTAISAQSNTLALIAQIKNALSNEKVKGCNFTFNFDRSIRTTIKDEELFIQQYPEAAATENNQTMISITTKLPIEISEGGQIKTTLKLICNLGSIPVSRINENTVGSLINKSNSDAFRYCTFSYTGNGNNLSTKQLEFKF